MKKLSLAIAVAALSSASALAADLPSRKEAPVYVPPPPVFSWTGLYAGLNIGGGWMDNWNRSGVGSIWLGNVWIPAYAIGGGGSSGGGVVGGGQIGYNYQLGSMFVVGLEADFQGTSISSGAGGGGLNPVRRVVDDFGTVRGRLGLTFPGWSQFLLYGTGGFAYGDVRLNHGPLGNLHGGAIGWSAGGGAEYAVLPNWSVKAEYLYTTLGNDIWGGVNRAEHHVNFHTVRAGVNYRFNWGALAPVVAGY